MGRRNLVDIDNKILDAVMHIGGQRGVAAVSAQKVAALCDISHFTCFNHFGTMRGMLDAAALKYRGLFLAALDDMIAAGKGVEEIWDEMLDFFLADPDKALYFRNYVIMYGADLIKDQDWRAAMLDRAEKVMGASSDTENLMALDFALTTSLHYVYVLSHDLLGNTPEMRETLRTYAFKGLNGILGR